MHLAYRFGRRSRGSGTRDRATLSGRFACEYFHELPPCQGVQTKKIPPGEQRHALFVRFSGEYGPRLATYGNQCSTVGLELRPFLARVAGVFPATLRNPVSSIPAHTHGLDELTDYAQSSWDRREFQLVALSQVIPV